MENKNIKSAVSCFIRYLVTTLITFFIYLSLTVIMVGFFTENVGYTVYSVENGTTTELYRYFYTDGEDVLYNTYESQGLQLTKVMTRSALEGTPKIVTNGITQVVGVIILYAFIHSVVWRLGDVDANLNATGNLKLDKFRGLKIGLIANIPIVLSYFILLLSKFNVLSGSWYSVYRFMNFAFFSFINVIFGQSTSSVQGASAGSIILGALLLIFIPLICHICYVLGYKRVTFFDRLVYKKK